jgi:hypothetical protein
MPGGNGPAISASPDCRFISIVIVADWIVVLSASVMETSVSATGMSGPPRVNVAV